MPIWVKGHWRKTRRNREPSKEEMLIIFIIIGVFAFAFIPMFRYFVGIIVGLIILILVIRYLKKRQRRLVAEPYYIRSQCPHCSHQWNRVRYYKGERPNGVTVTCDHCGNKYKHSRY